MVAAVLLVVLVVAVLAVVAAGRSRRPKATTSPPRHPLRSPAPPVPNAGRPGYTITVGMSRRDVRDRLGEPTGSTTLADVLGKGLAAAGVHQETLKQEFWLYDDVPPGRSTQIVIDHRGIVSGVEVVQRSQAPPSSAPSPAPSLSSVRVISTSFTTDGAALTEQHERVARRLAELVKLSEAGFSALSKPDQTLWLDTTRIDQFVTGLLPTPPRFAGRVEIRGIGHRLNEEGGKPLMLQVAERATVLTGQRTLLGHIAVQWDQIGDWMC